MHKAPCYACSHAWNVEEDSWGATSVGEGERQGGEVCNFLRPSTNLSISQSSDGNTRMLCPGAFLLGIKQTLNRVLKTTLACKEELLHPRLGENESFQAHYVQKPWPTSFAHQPFCTRCGFHSLGLPRSLRAFPKPWFSP